MYKISIIAPVYQKEKYIDQFLTSIRNQKLQDIEIILIDDGCSDRCPRILDDFAKKDKRCTVLHQKNQGVCAARNRGLEYASGEYVYIVDSDDWLADDALSLLWKEAERSKADVIYGQTITEGRKKTYIEKPFQQSFYTERLDAINEIQCALNNNNLIFTNCKEFRVISFLGGAPWRGMFRRTLIENYRIRYDEDLKSLGEDILFWQRIYEHVKSVSYIEIPIYHYRMVESSLSHGYKHNWLEIYQEVIRKQEMFLIEHKKEIEHWEAYYFRLILYIQQAMANYFHNPQNTKTKKELYKEFRNMLNTEPYHRAVKKVPLGKLVLKKHRFPIFLLRCRLYKIYWFLKKIKQFEVIR